jgi:uncharacterized protein (TIGR04255 family)
VSEKLQHAPIQEAILDFRLNFAGLPDKASFAKLAASLKDLYPQGDDLSRHQAQIRIEGNNSQISQASAFAGVKFQSLDGLFVFQAQTDGFTLSRLQPYLSWENLLEEAKKIWPFFEEAMQPITLHRIACRYINQFEVPIGRFELNEYLVCAPEIPKDLPQGINRYFLQQEIPAPHCGAVVMLTQALEPSSTTAVQFIIDIDVFKVETYDIREQKWWTDLESLRELKNQFFFKSITAKAKELFK